MNEQAVLIIIGDLSIAVHGDGRLVSISEQGQEPEEYVLSDDESNAAQSFAELVTMLRSIPDWLRNGARENNDDSSADRE